MSEETQSGPSSVRRGGRLRALWRRIRKPLAQSRLVKASTTQALALFLSLVGRTNRDAVAMEDLEKTYEAHEPLIIALWHGQHLMAPVRYPSKRPLVAMVSRSADAELNAKVIERFGIETVRGSGGRAGQMQMDKGGAQALVTLKKALDAGKNVCMIADIPHGTPRDAGLGIMLLARLSGRPILPVAMATSRRKVLEKTWDKTTINLPFGRSSVVPGELIYVAKKADEAGIEAKRQELTEELNAATEKAYRIVDGSQ